MLLTLLLLLAVSAPVMLAVEHTKGQGEPYALAGKRLVFTTWIFVRPGELRWLNDTGQAIGGESGIISGPWAAHAQRMLFPHGVRLVVEPAKRNDKPFIPRDRPWEAKGLGVGTLLLDDGKYRLWGFCQDADGICRRYYMESADGKTWQKPNLGLVEFRGSRDNNLLPAMLGNPWGDPSRALKPSHSVVHFSVFKDPNPSAPAAERYKSAREGDVPMNRFEKEYKGKYPYSIMALESDPGRVHAIIGAVSPDGLHWTDLKDPIAIELSDTHVVIDFDTLTRKYVLYTRTYMVGPRAESQPNPTERIHAFVSRRAIGRSESADFHHFPPSDIIIEPGDDWVPSDSLYTNSKTTIPGAPDLRVMFPAIYHQADETMTIQFYASDDGKVWHKVPGGPVLDTSNFGKFDGGCILAYPNLTELPDGDWVLPYTGFSYPHKYPRGTWSFDPGLAVWPKGRLAAIEAPEQGEFWTVGFMPPGRTIRINAVTHRAGGIPVEVCDFNGKPLPGHTLADATPIVGDQYRTLLSWGHDHDIGVGDGKPIMLHFVMDRAKIYGLDFE